MCLASIATHCVQSDQSTCLFLLLTNGNFLIDNSPSFCLYMLGVSAYSKATLRKQHNKVVFFAFKSHWNVIQMHNLWGEESCSFKL